MNRKNVEHIKNGFDKSLINFLLKEFESADIDNQKDNIGDKKSEREKKLKSQGIMNDEIRLNSKWYRLWENINFFDKARANMVNNQLLPNGVKNLDLIDSFDNTKK